ncbi:GNAT family N-acetyltransferase [Texcoconibacillus texcoconensis]|uniref:Ribosomal protein S18 acetylase RimI-like enzyme n=1 Tax=Texcoconibacillus texcoconensis TaxID=1095777 RepID=A0A840QPK1_9BACI|nr:GNAT family N-acetyltransferase [Texcoconibacillus texcoconensis]MBB5173304.1 ribosomal protein S18 acetylase RimI-like enzyme [Texcoconibacillus texcoconensis]
MIETTFAPMTEHQLNQLQNQIVKEEHLPFYDMLMDKRKTSTFFAQWNDEDLVSVVAFHDEYSLPTFAYYFPGNLEAVDVENLFHEAEKSVKFSHEGIALLKEEELPMFYHHGTMIAPPRKMQLMRHQDDTKLMSETNVQEIRRENHEEVQALAEEQELLTFSKDAFEKFPFFGVWEKGRLAAMGGFSAFSEHYVEINHVATASFADRKGCSQAVNSTLTEIGKQTSSVYVYVYADDIASVRLYESLGFEAVNERFFVPFMIGD